MDTQQEALEFISKTMNKYTKGLVLMSEVGWDITFKGQDLGLEWLETLGNTIVLGARAWGEEA